MWPEEQNDRYDAAGDVLLRHETGDHRQGDELVHVKLGVRHRFRAKAQERVTEDWKCSDDRPRHSPGRGEIGLRRSNPAQDSAENQANAADENECQTPLQPLLGMVVCTAATFAEVPQVFAIMIVIVMIAAKLRLKG